MTITTLVPQALAERCYLSEALLWTAFKRLPLSEWTEDGTDTRQALEYIDWPEARDRDLGCMSDEECAGAGLPPDPAYEQMMSGRVRLAPHHIRELMKGIANQERWAEALKESIEFHQRRDVWKSECSEFLDFFKAKLFVYLCEGQLQGFGKALPSQKYGQSIAQLEEEEGIDEWFEKPWEPIPSSFWISSGIDWEDDFAEGKGQAQALILVETRYSIVFVVSFFLMNEIMMRRGRSVTVPSVATCNEMRKHEAIET